GKSHRVFTDRYPNLCPFELDFFGSAGAYIASSPEDGARFHVLLCQLRKRGEGMSRRLRRLAFALVAVTALVVWFTMSASASTGQVPISGTGSPQTGDFTPSAGDVTQDEFPTGVAEGGPNPYDGTISLSTGAGNGVSVNSGKKAKSNPTFNFGFE